MPEPATKRLAVTFNDGLPMGTRATFTHDGQTWIAYPVKKNAQIVAVMDKMLGILGRITDDALRSINTHPDNRAVTVLATSILKAMRRADTSYAELAAEKGAALTS